MKNFTKKHTCDLFLYIVSITIHSLINFTINNIKYDIIKETHMKVESTDYQNAKQDFLGVKMLRFLDKMINFFLS